MDRANTIKHENNLKDWIDYFLGPDNQLKPEDHWLTIPDLCKLLRCSETSIYRKIKSGSISYSKPSGVMVWLSDLAKYVIKTEKI